MKWDYNKPDQIELNRKTTTLKEVEVWNVCPESNLHCIFHTSNNIISLKSKSNHNQLCQRPNSTPQKNFAYLEIRTRCRDVPAGLLIL